MSKKQLFFLALALLVGSIFGFLAGNLSATAHTSLSEKCDPNGSLIGNPFYVAWKSGYLELFVEDGTYNFNPPRVVTYSAVQ